MDRVKYKFHPGEYELGENEKFYSEMESKGWRLVNRGQRLSKFVPVEPSRTRYRIEVSSPGFLEEPGLSEGQLAVFEDCGWEYVASRSFLHIFRAPEGSGAPEFYSDPAQQAETLKKVRRDLWISWTITLLALALAAWIIPFAGKPWGKVFCEQFKRFVQIPTLYASYCPWLLWAVYELVWSTWKINRTYSRLKKGKPLDHAPKGKRVLHKLFHPGLLCLCALCLLLTAGQIITTRSEGLPTEPDGPYIMLSGVGWEGERGSIINQSSSVTHTRSLLADYWETLEVINPTNGRTVWMRQYIYRLRFPGMADTLARALMETSILTGPEAFSPIEAEGFDAAWATEGMELVAVKGNMAAYVEFLSFHDSNEFDPQAICAALQDAWED